MILAGTLLFGGTGTNIIGGQNFYINQEVYVDNLIIEAIATIAEEIQVTVVEKEDSQVTVEEL